MSEKKNVKALSTLFERLTHKHLAAELSPKELHDLHNKVKKALEAQDSDAERRKPPSQKSHSEYERWSNEEIAKGKDAHE